MSNVLPDTFVIRGASVVDGTGRPAFAADVTVKDGRLGVSEPGSVNGLHVLNADGLAVTPGFIDVHSHADLQAVLWSDDTDVHASRLLQGVTTEVVGNCGFSPFPVPASFAEEASTFLGIVLGAGAPTFEEFGQYADSVESAGPACNVAPLVGHGTLRVGTLGYEARAATADELDSMRLRLRVAMADGAFGLSSGLCYTPATFAGPSETRALAGLLAETGGIYATHVRNETDLIVESLTEAIDAVAGTGVPLNISHIKVAGRRNWGRSDEVLDLFEAARSRGVDLTADAYPYGAASTMLHSLLPPWLAEGGIPALLGRLTDGGVRARAALDLERGVAGWQNLGSAAGWDRVVVASAPGGPDVEGASIAGLALADDATPVDTIARLLTASGGEVVVVIDAMDDADVRRFLGWQHTLVGSDGIPRPGKPHPRLTGTFPRAVGRYRQAFGSFEEAVHRMTGKSAQRFSIPDRGRITDGAVADVVLVEPDAVIDTGTYQEPWSAPEGIRYVLMAGRPVVADREIVDGRSGRVLRRAG